MENQTVEKNHEHSIDSVDTFIEDKNNSLNTQDPTIANHIKTNKELSHQTKDIENHKINLPPLDGARGYLVVLGAFFVQFLCFGVASACVLQDIFEQIFKDEADVQLKLSFAGTLMEAFVNLMGPLAQIILARYGIHYLLLSGSFLAVLGLMMAGFTTEIWHLYLCQGVVFGSGASLLYCTVLTAVPQWFDKKGSPSDCLEVVVVLVVLYFHLY
ncbi:unnamed protein product [Cunninghamella echinulata]